MNQPLSNGSSGCCSCATLHASPLRHTVPHAAMRKSFCERMGAHRPRNSVRLRGLSGAVSAKHAQPPLVKATELTPQDVQRPVWLTPESSAQLRGSQSATASLQAASASSSSLSTAERASERVSLTKPVLGIWTAANASHRSQYLLRPPELPGKRQSLAIPPQQPHDLHTSHSSLQHGASSRDEHSNSSSSTSPGTHSLDTTHPTHSSSTTSSTTSSSGSRAERDVHSRMHEGTRPRPASIITSTANPTNPPSPAHPQATKPRKLLNARQLSSHISNSHHTAELARILNSHGPHGELDAQHISAMLARLPKLVDLSCYQRSCSATSHWPLHARQRMYSALPQIPEDLSQLLLALLQRFQAHMADGKYGVRQLSNLVWVLGKLKIGHGVVELSDVELLSAEMVVGATARLLDGEGEMLRGGKAQDLSNFALGCAYLGVRDELLWATLGKLTPSKLQDAHLQEVVNLAWCFAQSGMHSVHVFSSIAAHLTSPAVPHSASHADIVTRHPPRSSPTTPPTVTSSATTTTITTKPAARFPPTNPSHLAPDNTPLAAYLNEQQLPNLAWAFAKAGVYNPKLMDMICSATVGVIRNVNAQGLSNLAWSFATLRHTHPACLDAIVAAVGWKGAGLQGQALSNIAWAMTSLKHTPRELLNTLVDQVWSRTEVLKPLGITSFVVACVTNNRHEPVLFLALARESLLQIRDFQPATLVRLMWAFAKSGHHYKALLNASAQLLAADRSREALGRLQPEELCALLWTFSAAGPVAGPLARQTALLPLVHRLLLSKLGSLSPARMHGLALALAFAHPKRPVLRQLVLAEQQQPQQQPLQLQHPLAAALQAAAPACIRTLSALAVAQLVLALESLGGMSEHVLFAAAQRLSLTPSSPDILPPTLSSPSTSEHSTNNNHRQHQQHMLDKSASPAQSHHPVHSSSSVSQLPKQMLADLFSAYCVSHATAGLSGTSEASQASQHRNMPAWQVSALQQLSSVMTSESWLSDVDSTTLTSVASGCELVHDMLRHSAMSPPTHPPTRSHRKPATPKLLFASLDTAVAVTSATLLAASSKREGGNSPSSAMVGSLELEVRLLPAHKSLLSRVVREVTARIQTGSSFPAHHLAGTLSSLHHAGALPPELVYNAWPELWRAGTQQRRQWSQLLCTLAHLHGLAERVAETPSSSSSSGSSSRLSSDDPDLDPATSSPHATSNTSSSTSTPAAAASEAVRQRLRNLCEAVADRLVCEPGKKRLTATSILSALPALIVHLCPESLAEVLPLLHHHLLCTLVSMGPIELDHVRLQLQKLLEICGVLSSTGRGCANATTASARLSVVHTLVIRTLQRHQRVLEAARLDPASAVSSQIRQAPASLRHTDALVSVAQVQVLTTPALPGAPLAATAAATAAAAASAAAAAAATEHAATVGTPSFPRDKPVRRKAVQHTSKENVQVNDAAALQTVSETHVAKARSKKSTKPASTSGSASSTCSPTQLAPTSLDSHLQKEPQAVESSMLTHSQAQEAPLHHTDLTSATPLAQSPAGWNSHPVTVTDEDTYTDTEQEFAYSSLPSASPLDTLLPLTDLSAPFLPGFRVSLDRPRESYQGNICVAAVPQLLRRLRAETASRRLSCDIAALISSGRSSGLRLMLGPRVNSLGLGSRSSSEMQLVLVGGEGHPDVEDVVLAGGDDLGDLSRQLCAT